MYTMTITKRFDNKSVSTRADVGPRPYRAYMRACKRHGKENVVIAPQVPMNPLDKQTGQHVYPDSFEPPWRLALI